MTVFHTVRAYCEEDIPVRVFHRDSNPRPKRHKVARLPTEPLSPSCVIAVLSSLSTLFRANWCLPCLFSVTDLSLLTPSSSALLLCGRLSLSLALCGLLFCIYLFLLRSVIHLSSVLPSQILSCPSAHCRPQVRTSTCRERLDRYVQEIDDLLQRLDELLTDSTEKARSGGGASGGGSAPLLAKAWSEEERTIMTQLCEQVSAPVCVGICFHVLSE